MGKFIGLIAAALNRQGDDFIQSTELIEFLDETWVYYCRPHLGAPPAGWRDLADGTLRVSWTPEPMRHDHLEWEPHLILDTTTGAVDYMADAFGVEPGNNLFHLALPAGYLPVPGSWDALPLYSHADGGRFVIGWGGFEPVWPSFRLEPAGDGFHARADALDRGIETESRARRKQVLDPWGQTGTADRSALLDALSVGLDGDGVRTLAFELGVDYDDLGGEGKTGKLRELLLYLERQGQLGRLAAHLRRRYPHIHTG